MSESLPQPAPTKPKWSRGAKWIIGIGVCLTLLLTKFMVCHFTTFATGYSESEFDSGWWKWNWTCRCTPIRMQMAHDLERSVDMRGWRKEQVVDLLGSPDRHAYLQQYEKPGDFVYHLAPSWMDDYWFVVRFDEAGLVREAMIVED